MSVFTSISIDNYLFETDYFFVIKDKYPVSIGHLLIVSKRVVLDFFTLNVQEKNDLILMIVKCKLHIEGKYNPDGYNIGMQYKLSKSSRVYIGHSSSDAGSGDGSNGDISSTMIGLRHDF